MIAPQAGPQHAFCSSPADICFYGGQAGSGKTWAIVYEAARHNQIPGYGGIIFRRTSPELTGPGSVWSTSNEIYPGIGGAAREGAEMDWTFPSGATILFRHLQHDKHALGHQGKEYAFIGFDEVTHFSEFQFWQLVSRMRSTCGIKPYMRATCNPDKNSFVRGLLDWWIGADGLPIKERSGKLRWFLRDGEVLQWDDSRDALAQRFPGRDPISFTFIPASLADNPALTKIDPGYRARLENLPRVERERLLGGNWNVMPSAGMFFRPHYFEILDVAPTDMVAICRAWDMAATEASETNPDPDYTASMKLGMLRSGKLVILHAQQFRGTPAKVKDATRNMAAQDGFECTQVYWQDPGQAGKYQVEMMRQMLSGFITASYQAAKSKVEYAMPASASAEAGNIAMVRGPWNQELIRTLEGFPEYGHDDLVDAFSLAYMHMTRDNALSILEALSSL